MTAKVLFLLAVGTVLASAEPRASEAAFKDFVAKYDRVYASPEEEAHRFLVFESKLEFIQAENAKNSSFFLVINEFADQTAEEFKSTRFGMIAPPAEKLWAGAPHLGTDVYSGAPLPTSVDWVPKGAVTHVKNQGTCGSCWSFSSTGALEGAWQIKAGKLVSLSEQQLVDCSTKNLGCKGGGMDSAFQFLMKHNTCTESSYKYNGKDSHTGNKCRQSSCEVGIPKGDIKGFFDVPTDDTKALMEAVAQQPVAIAIEADQAAFQMYGGGIITKKCGNKLDHGVLLVGYGTDKGVEYWKVKNSWGASWGEEGYVRIERGLPGDGQCGIKAGASYPKVTSSGPSPPSPSPPSPSPTPPPAPTPSGCDDDKDFCKDKDAFKPNQDCPLIASDCKKTCGCCGTSPPSWCNGAATATIVV